MRTPPESVVIDLRAGGSFSYTMIGPDGDEHSATGSYLEVREPDRLAFTWGISGEEPAEMPVITVELADTGDGRTEMTFHVDGVAGRPGDEGLYDGWTEAFDALEGGPIRTSRRMEKMDLPPIVSPEEWEDARQALLVEEKELVRRSRRRRGPTRSGPARAARSSPTRSRTRRT